MKNMEEIRDILSKTISELKEEGLEPDLLLVGPEFLQYAAGILKDCRLKMYRIDELGYDAVIADSKYLGLMKKASRRISVEPLISEDEVWEEIKRLEV